MSAPAPANRRSTSGSRRFNPLKALQPKRRSRPNPVSSPVPAPEPEPASGSGAAASSADLLPEAPVFDYCKFIELDYVPMDTGYMVSMRPTKGYASNKSPSKGYSTRSLDRQIHSAASSSTPASRRTSGSPSSRDPNNAVLSNSSNPSACKGRDCSPTKGRTQKYTSCTDNHGIRPPPPEQYLTPLQQKEVCIRHLRARLKETINTLQDRDTEIDELRGRLFRMQEDWVEEECHRVEAQLALKDARQEIQQLKQAVDTIRARISEAGGVGTDVGAQKYFEDINMQNHKLENLLLSMELAQAGLAKEGEAIPGCRTRVVGSAPASVSGESPGGIRNSLAPGRGSCSCDGSPARSLTRSSTYTKLSDQAPDKNGNATDFPRLSGAGTQDSGIVCCGENAVPSRADLLLEAAFLSEETASLLSSYAQTFSHSLPNCLPYTSPHLLPQTSPHSLSHSMPCAMPESSTCEKLAPFRCSLAGVGCRSHPCLSHHHLYLHPLREQGIQTESCPVPAAAGHPSDLDTIAERRTFCNKACSPTSTWVSDEGDELDSITTAASVTTATVMSVATEPIPVLDVPPVPSLPRSATIASSMASPLFDGREGEDDPGEDTIGGETTAMTKPEATTVLQVTEGWQGQVSPDGGECLECQGAVEETTPCGLPGTAAECELVVAVGGGDGRSGKAVEQLHTEDVKVVDPLGGWTPEGTVYLRPHGLEQPLCADQPRTSQPRRSTSPEEVAGGMVLEVHDGGDEGKAEGGDRGEETEDGDSPSDQVQKSYWSRHFLVDLLAVAIPVVPTVAWLCRGPVHVGQPMYHIGSLLRGCCTVALHSLRRGSGLRHYPAGGGDLGGAQM